MLDAAFTPPLHAAIARENHQGDLGCYGYPTDHRTGWIVAVTHPQAEHWADANLRRRGYQTYLPLTTIHRRDRVVPSLTRPTIVPLFRGYLFVHYDSRDPRRPIRETPGVRDLIRCGSQIQWAPDGAVEAVQASLALAEAKLPLRTQWAPGTPVAVSRGALAGWPAVLTQIGLDHGVIVVMMLGALREVTVPLNLLSPRSE